MLLLSITQAFANIEVVVPYGAGGSTDLVMRRLEQILERNNIRITINNVPGGSSNIGFTYFDNNCSNPCILIASTNVSTNATYQPNGYPPNFSARLNTLYDLGESPMVFVTSSAGPKTLQELIEYSKTNTVFYGHGGLGSSGYITMKIFCDLYLHNCTDVAYRSSAFAINDLIANRVTVYAVPFYGLNAFSGNGLQHIGIASRNSIQNIPTTFSQNVNFEYSAPWFLFHKNLSIDQVQQIRTILNLELTRERLNEMGLFR
jgi:tripartite-type tricarboxylate transporter receptor subunit TctC